MAVTIIGIAGGYDVWGKTRSKLVTLQGDASYPAGGYPVSAASIGFRTIAGATQFGSAGAAASGAYSVVWDQANLTWRLWTAGAEVTTGASVASVQFNMLFLGN
jgi:hypothetical protein